MQFSHGFSKFKKPITFNSEVSPHCPQKDEKEYLDKYGCNKVVGHIDLQSVLSKTCEHFHAEQEPFSKPEQFQGDELRKKHAASGFFKCNIPSCKSCGVGYKDYTAPPMSIDMHIVQRYIDHVQAH